MPEEIIEIPPPQVEETNPENEGNLAALAERESTPSQVVALDAFCKFTWGKHFDQAGGFRREMKNLGLASARLPESLWQLHLNSFKNKTIGG